MVWFSVRRTKLSKEHTVNDLIVLDILGVGTKQQQQQKRQLEEAVGVGSLVLTYSTSLQFCIGQITAIFT